MVSSDKEITPPQSHPVAGSPLFEGKECDLLLATYSTLRTELLQRISTRDQVVFLTLTVFGTFLGLTALGSNAIYFVLLYPGVAFFLLNVYLSNKSKVKAISEYTIKIEDYVSNNSTEEVKNLVRWQTTYDEQKRTSEQGHTWPPTATVLFSLTAIISLAYGILLYFVETKFNPTVTSVLMIVAVVCCGATLFVQLRQKSIFRL